MTTKAKGSSVRQKLVNLSARLGIPFENVETAFILERLVARLTLDEDLSQHLIFKGGFVGLRVYDSFRYTVDFDALVIRASVGPTLDRARDCAEADLDDGVWFRFENQAKLATQGEYGGIRQSFRAGTGNVLKNLRKARVVHFDVGIGDPVTPGPLLAKTPSLIIPDSSLNWQVYPIETIVAEKIHALIAHGNLNSRSKDVYDLTMLLPRAEADILATALMRCFEFRRTELPDNLAAVLRSFDTKSLERGWTSATASIPGKILFKTAFDEVISWLDELESSFPS